MKEEIMERISQLRAEIPSGVELVAVSKFKPVEDLLAAYEAGQRIFGESRVRELIEKIPQLPSDVKWHFIGHLQTNKVRQLIGKTSLIESVDSERLLNVIEEESRKKSCCSNVLLQVHVAREETKFGFLPEELEEFFTSGRYKSLKNIKLCGIMAMASNTTDLQRVRTDFREAAAVFRKVATELAPHLTDFNILSMGMSGDWPIAVEEGANLIRVGSAIFGDR